ncbi:MAG: hypothetical protein Q6373_007060 [Candidatus Sigynarchaeota archaeon]
MEPGTHATGRRTRIPENPAPSRSGSSCTTSQPAWLARSRISVIVKGAVADSPNSAADTT